MSGQVWIRCCLAVGAVALSAASSCGEANTPRDGTQQTAEAGAAPSPDAAGSTGDGGARQQPVEEGGLAGVATFGAAGARPGLAGDGGAGGAPTLQGGAAGNPGGQGAAPGQSGAGGEPGPSGCGSPVANVSKPLFLQLGSLGPLDLNNYTSAVSDDGTTVVGASNVDADTAHAFSWTPTGGMTDLTVATNGGLTEEASLVSCDGSVIVGVTKAGRGRYNKATGVVELPGCGSKLPVFGIFEMNAAGDVLVGVCQDGIIADNTHVRRWLGTDPPTTIADLVGWGMDVSADGSIFGGVSIEAGVYSVFRWTAQGGVQTIAKTNGGANTSMSADGSTIVGQDESGKSFRWRNGVITPLPCAADAPYCLGGAMSGDGRVITFSAGDGTMVWVGDAEPYSLRDKLQALGVDLSPWAYINVRDMTADARVLVGSVNNAFGVDRRSYYLEMPVDSW